MSANGTENPSRLCHVVKVDTFDGYGFNLHAEQGKPGQYIGKVDEGSPAEKAGLKEGDRILEVNGISIANDNHKQVVLKIKAVANETKLLVVTPAANEKVPGLNKTPQDKKPEKIEKEKEKEKKIIEETNGEQKKTIDLEPKMNKLNLGMTAAEMREQLAARKKFDPKKIPMDLKHKFEIVKKL